MKDGRKSPDGSAHICIAKCNYSCHCMLTRHEDGKKNLEHAGDVWNMLRANALSFQRNLEPTRVPWKFDHVHTTLQRRKGLKTVSSLCTTEVQVVRWNMDQLWCHMSHSPPRRERVRSSPSDKHSQRLSKALLIVGGHVFVSCDTSLGDPRCKSIPCECTWLRHNCNCPPCTWHSSRRKQNRCS